MSEEYKTVPSGPLVDRLRTQLERLQKVQATVAANAELDRAIHDLSQDLEDLKIMAPHIYRLPTRR